ncbi:alpha-N-acetylgalactosamine-specific lectin-like [Hippocampus comes]|uniref:Alpha-N-acetylgalactosamine-specific lectin-like n=1 Tax=Hippocampus comes TaxID=109280 RepID=A0A3Q2Z1N9_HIPCM|nr:PREDICTED: alpha-N-acetylgalactosamine-specific lectin-like [Hippocampus comes]
MTAKMAFALRLLIFLFVINGQLSGVRSFSFDFWKKKVAINNCPPGWTQFNCNCFIYQAGARTFDDAESVCNSLGGNLASIRSELENTFVQGIIEEANSDVWIGYNDQDTEGTFVWTDGTTPDFENFDGGAASGVGNCVTLSESDGDWQDVTCTNTEAYVCIRPVDPNH